MIKSSVIPNNIPQPAPPKYPLIKSNGPYIVLFIYPRAGTLIGPSSMSRRLGEFRQDWAETNFFLYEGKIVLENNY